MANLNYRKSPSRSTIIVPLVIIAITIISVPAMAIVVPAAGTGYNINSFNEQHQIHYHNNIHYPAQRPPTAQSNALEPIQLVCKLKFSISEIKFITMSSTKNKSKSTVSHSWTWTQRAYNCHKPDGTFFNNSNYNYVCSHQNATLKMVTYKRLFYCCVLVDERHLDSPHYYDEHDHFRFNSKYCKSGKSFGDFMDINGPRQSQPQVTIEPHVMTVPTHTDSKHMTGLNETGIATATTNPTNENEATTEVTEAKQQEIKKPNQTETIGAGMSTITVNVIDAKAPEQNQNGTGAVGNQGVGVSNSTNNSNSNSDGENSIWIDEPTEPESTSVVTVYAYDNFEGASTSFKIHKDCETLPLDWQRRISSINTHGTCVEVCGYSSCDGTCINVAPEIRGHSRLRDANFDKRIISMRACSADYSY